MRNIIIIMISTLFIYKIQELLVENKQKNKNIDDFINNIEDEYTELKIELTKDIKKNNCICKY